ncbi:type 11 methyltransferase [Klebsiella michiganensis]|nr:type 11 methyltransferase [Klebsiella michiganensis]
MSQNIYDDPAFFAGYATLDRSVKGLEGAPEWPTIQQMLPPLSGLRVVDLGCGYGWFCRWARDRGAAQVDGLDLSSRMLERAREMTEGRRYPLSLRRSSDAYPARR